MNRSDLRQLIKEEIQLMEAQADNLKKAKKAFAEAWGGEGGERTRPGGPTGAELTKSYFDKKLNAFNMSGHDKGDMARVRARFKYHGVDYEKIKKGVTTFYKIK